METFTPQGLARRALSVVRSRPGAREVQWMLPNVRGGNILYYWQWAWKHDQEGRRAAILHTSHMDAWMDEFPLVRAYTLTRGETSLFDKRRQATQHGYSTNFTETTNRAFCRELIESSPSFQSRLQRARSFMTPETVVVNVRRGDYYSVPEFRERFALDTVEHVRQALQMIGAQGRAMDDIVVVSDDIPWCRENLVKVIPQGFRTDPDRESMFDDLAVLASSSALVLANSTFSYWGSFLASARDGKHLAVAPAYHERTENGALESSMLNPEWLRTDTAFPTKGH